MRTRIASGTLFLFVQLSNDVNKRSPAAIPCGRAPYLFWFYIRIEVHALTWIIEPIFYIALHAVIKGLNICIINSRVALSINSNYICTCISYAGAGRDTKRKRELSVICRVAALYKIATARCSVLKYKCCFCIFIILAVYEAGFCYRVACRYVSGCKESYLTVFCRCYIYCCNRRYCGYFFACVRYRYIRCYIERVFCAVCSVCSVYGPCCCCSVRSLYGYALIEADFRRIIVFCSVYCDLYAKGWNNRAFLCDMAAAFNGVALAIRYGSTQCAFVNIILNDIACCYRGGIEPILRVPENIGNAVNKGV